MRRPSPHGEGGLKLRTMALGLMNQLSLPTRGGWIEINGTPIIAARGGSPSPHGEGGLKSVTGDSDDQNTVSLPTRGGWIEILVPVSRTVLTLVPPHTGRVA